MNIEFYICNCDNRVVDKTEHLVLKSTKNCQVFRQTGIMHPSLLLTYSSDIVNYNYFRIQEWGDRWYQIVGMEVMPGGRIIVTGSEDVLHTNREAIKNLDAYVVRTENTERQNKLVLDGNVPTRVDRKCETIKFDDVFNSTDTDKCYLLTVIGGVNVDN